MNRNAGTVALCVAVCAVLMYCKDNFRLKLEPVGGPDAKEAKEKAPAVKTSAEPEYLPDEVTAKPRAAKTKPGRVKPAAYTDDDVEPTTPVAKTGAPSITKVIDGTPAGAAEPLVWGLKGRTDVYLFARTPELVLSRELSPEEKGTFQLKIKSGAQQLEATKDTKWVTFPGNDRIAINFGHEDTKGLRGAVTVELRAKGKEGPLDGAVPLRLPEPPPASPPTVTGYRITPFVPDPTPITKDGLAGKPIPLGTYLQLEGTVPAGAVTFGFIGQKAGGEAFDVEADTLTPPAPEFWITRLKNLLPFDPGTTGFFAVRYPVGASHAYLVPALAFRAEAVLPPLAAPRLDVTAQPNDTASTVAKAPDLSQPGLDVYRANTRKLRVTVTPAGGNAHAIRLFVDDLGPEPTQTKPANGTAGVPFDIELGRGRDHNIRAVAVRGDLPGKPADADVKVEAQGPVVDGAAAPGFGTGGGTDRVALRFAGPRLNPATAQNRGNYSVKHNEGNKDGTVTDARYDPVSNTVTLTVTGVGPGSYTVSVLKPKTGEAKPAAKPAVAGADAAPETAIATAAGGIVDEFGNPLRDAPGAPAGAYFAVVLVTTALDQALPSQSAGVTLQTGPPTHFPIYMKPPVYPEGFNPSDRVETRVMRLYYYRDGHRVAQLVNRSVKSYNAATVDVRRRAADRVRDDADRIRDERKMLELQSVRAAQNARAAEAEATNVQNRVATARGQAAQAREQFGQLQARLEQFPVNDRRTNPQAAQLQAEIDAARQALQSAEAVERNGPADTLRAQGNVTAARETEAVALEKWVAKDFEERRAREGQFRIEVAAAREDPDTYAPGDLNSDDPVMRVSIAVIGEGLIQIRGPIKGLNVIRTMVNQIDSPVGQVRVAVHTLQVNGERADRMEKVIANIQRYLDHSRFLTAQSSQMLRNAVTAVASRRATEAGAFVPGCTQAERDQRYLYAFYGKDFTDELTLLDSEFLKTGNKLLSMHSMDTTSLSAGLFQMALAKNDVRAEIINEFLGMVGGQLPQAELTYYQAGINQPKHCDACKDKKEYLLAYNSKFQSFIGFFNAQVTGADTLNPLQREFIKLAQIFKARMVTEMQLSQRVMERALLEERINVNYVEELRKAKAAEDEAKKELATFRERLQLAIGESNKGLLELSGLLDRVGSEVDENRAILWDIFELLKELKVENPTDLVALLAQNASGYAFQIKTRSGKTLSAPIRNPDGSLNFTGPGAEVRLLLLNSRTQVNQFAYLGTGNKEVADRIFATLKVIETTPASVPWPAFVQLRGDMQLLSNLFAAQVVEAKKTLTEVTGLLTQDKPEPVKAFAQYRLFRDDVLSKLNTQEWLYRSTRKIFDSTDVGFQQLADVGTRYQLALKKAQEARRPLDEKKLLDMLVDQMEDKFVEILEGTRAHTANIDNYMKSVTTALDDDFNTQYYLPSFARCRTASRAWDVALAQIETTSVLTNNRALGKVSPAATFEFDLPKRNILITEAMQSAKTLMDEYGALTSDPTFLALTKLYSGSPVSMMQQGGGGLAAVRGVLPGLPTTPDEKIMAQGGPGQKQFGAALDGLIPDPAIYKFETGTGYEIRPVLSPDGQAVVFNFNYMYTTNVREPVRADEKHLGRVDRHFVNTDVQLGNFELREVSKYQVAIKAARTAKGVQLLQDIPGVGVLFRPLPSAASSLQQNLIYSQATIFPTLFDLMGLRYAPAVADLDPLAERMGEFAARYRRQDLEQRIYDIGATRVDDALRTPYGERRFDFYRSQMTLPFRHPNGYVGIGLRLHDGTLREGYDVNSTHPDTPFAPGTSPEGRPKPYPNGQYGQPGYGYDLPPGYPQGYVPHSIPQLPPNHPGANFGGAVRPNPATGPLPGMPAAPVNVGKSVPYTGPLTTLPPAGGPPRPAPIELPGTSLPPVITPSFQIATPKPPAVPVTLPPTPGPLAPLPPGGR